MTFVTELNNENFEDFLKHELVLIDIWAEWCGPCKMISPIVDQISSDFQGKLLVGKLDTDSNKEKVQELGIRNIPTILLFKNGEIVDKSVGVTTKEALTELINTHID